MDKKTFMKQLKATLDSIIKQNEVLEARLAAIEHSVNDVVIGGLIDAANEYQDNENFSIFTDTYGESLTPYAEHCKVLYGDDYDIIEEMYAGSKDREDVASWIKEQIDALQSKLDALKSIGADKEEVVVEVEEKPEVTDNTVESGEEAEEFDEEELKRISKEVFGK